MSELDEDGGQFPPYKLWYFRTRELEKWFDGTKRILTPNVDFPPDMPFENLKRRLEQAAHKRRGTARVWREADGRVGMVLTPPWHPIDTGRGV